MDLHMTGVHRTAAVYFLVSQETMTIQLVQQLNRAHAWVSPSAMIQIALVTLDHRHITKYYHSNCHLKGFLD